MTQEILSRFQGVPVLVTGTTGFKGSWLSHWLLTLGAEVTGLALPPHTDPSLFEQLGLASRIEQRFTDIRDFDAVTQVFEQARPAIVLHLAAQPIVRRGYREPKYTFDTNMGGTVNILEAARLSSGVRAVVVVTSDKCYRNLEWVWGYRENDQLGGGDPYSASKAGAELIYEAYRTSFFDPEGRIFAASARAGNVIGGGDWAEDRIVPDCIRALRAGSPITLRSPQATRPWQHVLDPLYGYLLLAGRLLAQDATATGSWNFGPASPADVTVRDVSERIVERWGSGHIVIETDSTAAKESGLLALDSTKAMQGLGWRPVWRTDEAVDATVDWYRAFDDGKDVAGFTTGQIARFTDSI